jgi:1-acyl-sn-glycerol-3-phosphate acyltransferase
MLLLLFIVPLIVFWDKGLIFRTYIFVFLRISRTITQIIISGLKVNIETKKEIKKIKSSIILCNHLSYLDAILILSTNRNTVAIIKDGFFKIPFLGWILTRAGFIPAFTNTRNNDEQLSKLCIERMESIEKTLKAGINVLIFPEGTRSNNGTLNRFKSGAFKIAKKYNVPIAMLMLTNTQITLSKSSIIYNTCVRNIITLKKIGSLSTDGYSVSELKEQAYDIYSSHNKKEFQNKHNVYTDLFNTIEI